MRILRSLSAAGLCLALFQSVLLSGPVPAGKPSAYPDWWFEQDVIARLPAAATKPNPVWPADYPVADDFAVANLGQLKHIAAAAYADFTSRLPGGAGSAIQTMAGAWAQPPAGGVVRDDYAALNQGQLKSVAKLYYDRLAAFVYSGAPLGSGQTYPWTSTATDDEAYATVNIGQLKSIFSFDSKILISNADTDADSLSDFWERGHFGGLTAQSGTGDADGDGLNNRAEYLAGTNPNSIDPAAQTALSVVIYSP